MKNRLFLLLTALCAFAFAACEGDGDADYGFARIYMPQALSTGGLDNSYAVPSGGGTATYNFRVEGETVRIVLGVMRSGHFDKQKGFTVKVGVSAGATAEAAAAFGGEAMPDIYSLPESVTVPDGRSGETFYLSIPVSSLTKAEYAGKKFVLAVGISEPSAYELAERGTVTAVVVDVDALKALL